MALVSDNIIDKWYKKDSLIYKNFSYVFQNPMWNFSIPTGFSLCPYFWTSWIIGFLVLRCVVTPLYYCTVVPLKFILGKNFQLIVNLFDIYSEWTIKTYCKLNTQLEDDYHESMMDCDKQIIPVLTFLGLCLWFLFMQLMVHLAVAIDGSDIFGIPVGGMGTVLLAFSGWAATTFTIPAIVTMRKTFVICTLFFGAIGIGPYILKLVDVIVIDFICFFLIGGAWNYIVDLFSGGFELSWTPIIIVAVVIFVSLTTAVITDKIQARRNQPEYSYGKTRTVLLYGLTGSWYYSWKSLGAKTVRPIYNVLYMQHGITRDDVYYVASRSNNVDIISRIFKNAAYTVALDEIMEIIPEELKDKSYECYDGSMNVLWNELEDDIRALDGGQDIINEIHRIGQEVTSRPHKYINKVNDKYKLYESVLESSNVIQEFKKNFKRYKSWDRQEEFIQGIKDKFGSVLEVIASPFIAFKLLIKGRKEGICPYKKFSEVESD